MKTASTTETAVTPALPALQLLVLGSNVDAASHLAAALGILRERYPVLAISGCKPSAAADSDQAPPYLNQAVLIETALDPAELKRCLRGIEADLGRVRPAPQPGLCPIDIDLVAQLRPGVRVWDRKSWSSAYGRSVIHELVEFAKRNNIEGFVWPDIDTV